jgi:hypothetical protein
MILSTVHPGPVELSLERRSPSSARSQEVSTCIMRLSSGGYCNSNQELKDMQVTHVTRSDMEAAGKLEVGSVKDNLFKVQVTRYLQQIDDDVQE